MSVETNQLRSTRTVLEAVKAALAALTITVGNKTPKAFGTVEIFDLADWDTALQTLVTTEDRICLVLWAGDAFENQREISILTTRRITKIELLVSDFRIDSGVAAQIGDDSQPGVAGLVDAVLASLTGVILDVAGGKDAVALVPVGMERLTITDQDKQETPGRHVISLTFDAVGQWMQVGISGSEAYA